MSPNEQPAALEPEGKPNVDLLVEAVLAGDLEAYREVIGLGEAKVRVVLAAILPDRERVEDIAQEVFVTAYGKLKDYRPGTDFLAWLTMIARNLALNERRRWLRYHDFKEQFRAELETALDPIILEAGERFSGDLFEALRDCLGRCESRRRTGASRRWTACSTASCSKQGGRPWMPVGCCGQSAPRPKAWPAERWRRFSGDAGRRSGRLPRGPGGCVRRWLPLPDLRPSAPRRLRGA